MRTSILLICVLLLTKISFAQSKFSCEIRPRFEYRNGYKSLRDSLTKPAFITSQRSRINFSFEKDKISTFISIQDVRIWGEEKTKDDIANALLHEAWAEIKLNNSLTLKAGRQEIKYDDERLLATSNWNNSGSSHDLALLKFKKSKFQSHLGLAYNNDIEKNFESNYPVKFYKSLSYLWLAYNLNDNLKASVISIADGNQKDKNENILYVRSTNGGNINYKNDSLGLYFDLAGYYQLGKNIKGNDLNAYFFSAKAGYFLTKKMDVFIATDYFSGNDETDTSNKTVNAFNNLYGTFHKYLGLIDYFSSVDQSTAGGGLIDLYCQLNYKLNSKMSTSLAYHNFQLSGTLIDKTDTVNTSALNRQLGSEIDFSANFKINENANVQFGYSTFFAKKTLSIIKGGDFEKLSNWGWVMLTLKI